MSQAIGQRGTRPGELPAMRAAGQQRRGQTEAKSSHLLTADVLDRLARLRMVLPAMGQELAGARREAAKLRIENGRLRDRLHSLEAKASRKSGSPSGS